MSDAESFTTPAERVTATAFGSERRRCEYLAWRAIVRREVGSDAEIVYNECGAPVVRNYPIYIGVSHCRGYVAVGLSDAPCAVDIELAERNFSRVVPRYMSAVEQALSSDALWAGVAWCAKEALYKYSGRQELDFLRDLHLLSVDFTVGTLVGCIENGEPIGLTVHRGEEYIAASIF